MSIRSLLPQAFILFAVSLALTFSACSSSAPPRAVILITLDGARADHFSTFGYRRPTTPNIDRIAAHGVKSDKVVSPALMTKPSLTSLLAGLDYRYHHIIVHSEPLAQEYTTIAEVFRKAGYLTAGFTATPHLAKSLHYDQGFDIYTDHGQLIGRNGNYAHADELTDRVLKFLDTAKSMKKPTPLFIYIHYEEPHPPWFAPSPWVDVAEGNYQVRPLDAGCQFIPNAAQFASADAAKREKWIAMYDGAIQQADAQIGRILDRLEENGLLQDSLIAVTTDHGYQLGERYAFTHGVSPYNDTNLVPMIVADYRQPLAPALPENFRARTHDVSAFLVDRAGLTAPEAWDARDFMLKPYNPGDLLFSTGYGSFTVQSAHAKLFWFDIAYRNPPLDNLPSFGYHFFNLGKDPLERHDLFDEHAAGAGRLKRALDQYRKDLESEFVIGGHERLDEQTRKKLEALGYIESDSGS